MSGVKELIAEDERKREVAIQIAIKAGVLRRCEFGICPELTWNDSDEQLNSAYRYAARSFKDKGFKSQKELTDLDKESME